MSVPTNVPAPAPLAATSFLLQRAEELLASLPGVVSARIVTDATDAVSAIHVVTSPGVTPEQTARTVESALIVHLGVRVDQHRISVTPATVPARARTDAEAEGGTFLTFGPPAGRRYYFDGIAVQRLRDRGLVCQVTLRNRKGSYIGSATGVECEHARLELAARATLEAIAAAEGLHGMFVLDGVQIVDVFERHFAFAAVAARQQRLTALLTGTCEVQESMETAGALAVLDATNRWLSPER